MNLATSDIAGDDAINDSGGGGVGGRVREQTETAAEQDAGEDKDTAAAPSYESCIKINGRPILPPVMTPELRKECRMWKAKAVETEQKLVASRRDKTEANDRAWLTKLDQRIVSTAQSCPHLDLEAEAEGAADADGLEDSSDALTDSDLEPKSFAEIHSLLRKQRSAASTSESPFSSPRRTSSSLLSAVTPTPSSYQPDVYSDHEESAAHSLSSTFEDKKAETYQDTAERQVSPQATLL